MSQDFLSDPLWYKDAVIYELHVRSFFDANDDGYGDFEGLRRKLPYLAGLGVNTLWLLPFLESPLRDDGYDTADYLKILPVHGTLDDFGAFLDEAHARGMRVITELVLNHTSDEHPWFQEARDPRSPRHDWYVWSDTTEKYADARIIFTDTETSNWTWDRTAQRYYWHRFFSHQPDLNYDNPEVCQAMTEAMFFWLDLGVDGLRLDAVPYLYEREGTSCENLPETLAFIRELRRAVEARYGPGKALLAEANQWPEDTRPYFGDGDGVQMAFNFPIMPRLYMALHRENRRPFVEVLALTEDIPDEAQWALFLRNHDELTLEMVTDEERAYLYDAYAPDARHRINVGIRRRLAPLLGGERRRLELMNALLFSLKGSPVIYYGDEIGMGDDPFLDDRNGVRTPMQWSADKNGGFSRAPHHRLFMPPIDRGRYSYEFVNVDDAEQDPHSLLHFMKDLLALRRQHARVFGRGSFELIPVENPRVLAFRRAYEDEQILVVANLSHLPQSAHLPVAAADRGFVPVELFSRNPFPPLGDAPYPVQLGPHGFYWLTLQPQDADAAETPRAATAASGTANTGLPILRVDEGLQNLLVKTMVLDDGMERLEDLLPGYLKEQRWFGAKEQAIEQVRIQDAVQVQGHPFPIYLSILRVELSDSTVFYALPLALAWGAAADRVLATHPQAALAWIERPGDTRPGLLHDAVTNPVFWRALFGWWQAGGKARSLTGLYVADLDAALRTATFEQVRVFSGEQSNSSALLDDRFYVKLYRRLEQGTHPETELLEHLTAAGFPFAPRLHGTLSFKRPAQTFALGILQQAFVVETDGWTYARAMMARFLDRLQATKPPTKAILPTHYTDEVPEWLEQAAPDLLALARVLGSRTAELHLALATADTPALRPEPGTLEDTRTFLAHLRREMDRTRRLLEERADALPPVPDAAAWKRGLNALAHLMRAETTSPRIRVHGDYHLGQVVRSDGELYLLDFEGEPTRTLEERRTRDCSLRDVAGMLRSIEYAALSAWQDHPDPPPEDTIYALVRWCQTLFMRAYYATAGASSFLLPSQARRLFVWAYLFHKALYEVRYELSHRPDWTWLPLRGLHHLLDEAASVADTPH